MSNNITTKKELPAAQEKHPVTAVSTRCALSLFYYLMWADGQTTEDEFAKFDELGNELDPSFRINRTGIVKTCYTQVKTITDPAKSYEVLVDGIRKALQSSNPTQDAFITPKHLLWNLLTFAYSDGECAEIEKRLIQAIVEELQIDKAVFLELESSLLTMLDLEKELSWIKTTDRPYLVIEAMVNEIADRKDAVMQGVKSLISM
ncbi:MAG: TerB family tellurite resistance protein [Oscillospiraceae bacterium]|nr:TerB family tellurite resistance protein [Oscillospiraceae bacterium]